MVRDSNIIARSGNYFVMKCDSFYAAYSGYEHIVCHQALALCKPKQLAGFGPGRVEEAKAFMATKAAAGVEERKFQRTKRNVTRRLGRGEKPCPHDDHELARHLMKEGFTLVRTDRTYRWFAPPRPSKKTEPTLFDGNQGR